MPLTDEQKNQRVWVRKGGPSGIYHTEKRLPESEFNIMRRGDAEALNLKPCPRCESERATSEG